MAQQTTVRFLDDLHGSDAAGTFDFSLEGRTYQIDLSDENAAKLRAALTRLSTPPTRPAGAAPDVVGHVLSARRRRRSRLGPAGRKPPRSASGPGRTATRSTTAGASPR